jgi:hypothetical protein
MLPLNGKAFYREKEGKIGPVWELTPVGVGRR